MDRKQYVVLNGERSAGPLLFLIHIDSVDSTALDGNCITLYADDMLLYRIVNNPQDFIHVQQDINNLGF